MQKQLSNIIEDILRRIERINNLIHTHESQDEVDKLAVEGYIKLKNQYKEQLNELLEQFELRVENFSNAA
jgi:hypothetical protein